jgi:hypothetical protein
LDQKPEETELEPLAESCDSIGMSLVIVPSGFELTPPQINSNDETEYDDEIELSIDAVETDRSGRIQSDSSDAELDSWC